MSIPEATAILLGRIIAGDDYLIAYQIAFDILDNENQSFSKRILDSLAIQQAEGEVRDRVNKLKSILTGETRDKLYL